MSKFQNNIVFCEEIYTVNLTLLNLILEIQAVHGAEEFIRGKIFGRLVRIQLLNNFFLTFNTLLRIDPWRLVDKDNKKQLLGGELCAWSEMNNEYNLPTKLFPRGAAMSFRLWNPNASYSNAKVAEMLIKHQYRLNAYGVPHQRVKFYAN